VSSLVLGGGQSVQLVLFNGGQLPIEAIAKSAVVDSTLVVTVGQNENLGFVAVDGPVGAVVQAYGAYAGTDFVWTVADDAVIAALGSENQPVLLLPVLGSALVP